MQSIMISVSICRWVRGPVCPRAYIRNGTSKVHKAFCAHYQLWLWLGPLATVQYIMYFRFCERCHVFT